MPLSRSSGNPVLVRVFWDGRWPRVSDDAVEVSREVSLQASDDLAFRLAFRKLAVYGRKGFGVPAESRQHDAIERCVGLSVTTAVQSEPCRHA